jgi:Tol biopolymer transport system component
MRGPVGRGRWWGLAGVAAAAIFTGIVVRVGWPGHAGPHIHLIAPAGGHRSQTARMSEGKATAQTRKIVFSRRQADGRYHLHLIAADGLGDTALTSGPAEERAPAWSPDGTQIAFVRRTGLTEKPTRVDLYVMNADGTDLRRLTKGPGLKQDPSWSPDGLQIVFSALDPVRGTARMAMTGLDGREGPPLVPPPHGCSDREPAWSPEGSRIAFSRQCVGRPSSLYLMNADGTNIVLLTELGRTPDWSPDGSRIAYTGSGALGPAVFLINADGTQRLQLTAGVSADPSWSPQGKSIVFTGSEALGLTLFAINVDGSGMRRLTSGLANAVTPSW